MIDKKLKREAIKAGLCKEWQDSWEETGLIEKYLRGITWAMERDYPSYKLMSKMKDALNRNGVYNQEKLSIKCDRETYVFNGCDVYFEIGGYQVCRIYIGRGSKVKVNAKGNSILYIDSYGGEVQVDKEGDAFFRIWEHKKGSTEY